MKLAGLHKQANKEPYWHVQVALVLAVVLQLILSDKLTIGPKYLLVGFEISLLLLLAFFAPLEHSAVKHIRRTLAIVLIAALSFANITSLILVVSSLIGTRQVSGRQLIVSALAIYLTNIIIFGLWYWELDSNGSQDQKYEAKPIDFLFPQMDVDSSLKALKSWNPTFFDYLYVSVTNASAFSPTDTMPLTHRAKLLMSVQSTISLITIALVAARAVNILS